MIKLINILKEIGEGSRYYNTERTDQGKQIWFRISDSNFPLDNFWISIGLGNKDDIIDQTSDNTIKPRFDLTKGKNAARVDFGIAEGGEWSFPVINKGYLYGIMGTVTQAIKSVLDDNKDIKHLLFIPAQKIKSTNKTKPNKNFKPNKNTPPVQQDTAISDNGAQREKLYLAYVQKQMPGATQTKEKGWNVINLK